jgi:hypothetical protein
VRREPAGRGEGLDVTWPACRAVRVATAVYPVRSRGASTVAGPASLPRLALSDAEGPATLALTLQGLVLLVPSLAEESAGHLTLEPRPQPAGSRLADLWRDCLCSFRLQPGTFALDAANRPGKPVFGGNENKSARAFSNRNSNDSRRLATHSQSTISDFLIATRMHFLEEKAKRE